MIIMDLETFGRILDLVGKLMISYTAVRIHYRFWKEHKVDELVFSEMKKEQAIGVIGMLLMVVGFIFEVLVIK